MKKKEKCIERGVMSDSLQASDETRRNIMNLIVNLTLNPVPVSSFQGWRLALLLVPQVDVMLVSHTTKSCFV